MIMMRIPFVLMHLVSHHRATMSNGVNRVVQAISHTEGMLAFDDVADHARMTSCRASVTALRIAIHRHN
jgi:hypothetical protein